ncbi:MAG: FecR domain-containing protein [Rhodothermales bacterium]|nr:FecR domain-containing protein [Rhodothermales bacterium]
MNESRPYEPHPALPLEVLEALAGEPAEEQAALKDAWAAAAAYRRTEPSDETFARLGDEIWQHLESAIQPEPAPQPLRLVRAPLRLVRPATLRYAALAACIALLVAVGLSLRTSTTTLTAPAGQTLAVELPDGSEVQLNSASTLTYRDGFGAGSRTVALEGEAYFDVVTAEAPFIVESASGTVTVLGTEFNVRAREAATVVTVAEGTVRVAPRRAETQAVVITAGQTARLAAPDAAPERLDDAYAAYALAWRAGGFKFADVALGEVIREIERRFDVRIAVENNELLDDPVALLKENPLDAEEILRDLCEYNGCEYRQTRRGYAVYQSAGD